MKRFGDISSLKRHSLCEEMDNVWDGLGLDNRKRLDCQGDAVGEYYKHPIWVVNGIFSEVDPVSRSHRKAMAQCISNLPVCRIADYGGGSGVLARFIAESQTEAKVEIIEPYPNEYFGRIIQTVPRVKFVSTLTGQYDLVIAEDVLEHVDEPAKLALELVEAVKMDKYLLFASCFYPDIKCHLPATFYLRHQFKRLMSRAGLVYEGSVKGASHAHLYRRVRTPDYRAYWAANMYAAKVGPAINWIGYLVNKVIRRT